MTNIKLDLNNCHDCGAKPGEIHKRGCDTERCSVCAGQRFLCEGSEKCKKHDPAFARWTGMWPGAAEALLLGIGLNDIFDYRLHEILFIKPKT